MARGHNHIWRALLGAALLLAATSVAATATDSTRVLLRSRAGLSSSKRARLLAHYGARVRRHIVGLDTSVVDIPQPALRSAMAALRRSGAFISVEEDHVAHAAALPSDPLAYAQWGAVQINTFESWTLTRGSAASVVAVLDTGVDAAHPDLLGHVLSGYDLVNDDADASDDNGHGTAMAGIITAQPNNGIGVTGIAPDSPVLPVKVLGADGSGSYSAITQGIAYAVDHGARIVNMSLGGSYASPALQSAIDYARAHDVVVVAAAGNYGTADPLYPAACDGVVAVSASDARDRRAIFSSYGSDVSLAAPGVGILTTVPGGGYAGVTGTSPATAVASGAFALLLAANPSMGAADAVTRMTANAVDIATAGWDPYAGFGRVDAYAALVPGSVIHHAPDLTAPTAAILNPAKDSLVNGLVPVDVSTSDNTGVVRVDLEVDRHFYASASVAPFAFAWDTAGFAAGSHRLRATAYDAAGNHTTTTEIRVDVTPGVGLLVKRGMVRFGRTAGSDYLSVSGIFQLPAGLELDSANDAVTIDVSGPQGMVFSMPVAAATLTPDRSGAMRVTGLAAIPTNGGVSVRIAKARSGSGYTFTVTGRGLSLTNVAATMNLQIAIGSNLLSQAVLFRDVYGRLMLP